MTDKTPTFTPQDELASNSAKVAHNTTTEVICSDSYQNSNLDDEKSADDFIGAYAEIVQLKNQLEKMAERISDLEATEKVYYMNREAIAELKEIGRSQQDSLNVMLKKNAKLQQENGVMKNALETIADLSNQGYGINVAVEKAKEALEALK